MSGYSNQANLFVPRIRDAGHHITVFEVGATGLPRLMNGIQIIPSTADPLGNDILAEHYQRLRSDALLSLIDVWGINPSITQGMNFFPITPIDHAPLPIAVEASLKSAICPIAISQFGFHQMREAGFDPLYMPHAFDSSVFHPMNRAECRRALNVPADAFFVAFVGVNDSVPSRKGIPELLAAWQIFSRAHGEAVLYLHTSQHGNLASNPVGGVRIDVILSSFGILTQSVIHADPYSYKTGFPASYLAQVYNAADVLVLPSRSEGFGIPLIEAQACGTPVITTDISACAELCSSGWLVETEPDWTWQSALMGKPSIQSIYERLEEAYQHRDDVRFRQMAYEFSRDYEIEHVFAKYTVPILDVIMDSALGRML